MGTDQGQQRGTVGFARVAQRIHPSGHANGKLFGEAAFAEHHRTAPDGRRRLADRLSGLLSDAHGQHRGISRHTDALHEARLSNVPILP